MSEGTGHSRLRHFLLMLPFFLIGVGIPVYFFGFSGDGPVRMTESYSPTAIAPASPSADGRYSYPPPGDDYGQQPPGIVSMARGMFESIVDSYVSPNTPPWLLKVGFLGALFVGGFVVLRLLLSFFYGGILSFLIHKAAGPMFMGFMAVGSTWGIHQTIAQQFGMQWAAATVSLTAAIATLFALAGVKLR